MRKIEVADDLKVRFPARSAEFDDGFGVGVLAALMSLRGLEYTRSISPGIIDQCTELAGKLGYYLAERDEAGETARVTFRSRRSRPKLRIVSSKPLQSAAS